MNGATDGIMVIDANDRVNFANRRLKEMLGAGHGSLVNQPFQVVKDGIATQGDDQTQVAAQLDRAMLADGTGAVDNLSMKDSLAARPRII